MRIEREHDMTPDSTTYSRQVLNLLMRIEREHLLRNRKQILLVKFEKQDRRRAETARSHNTGQAAQVSRNLPGVELNFLLQSFFVPGSLPTLEHSQNLFISPMHSPGCPKSLDALPRFYRKAMMVFTRLVINDRSTSGATIAQLGLTF